MPMTLRVHLARLALSGLVLSSALLIALPTYGALLDILAGAVAKNACDAEQVMGLPAYQSLANYEFQGLLFMAAVEKSVLEDGMVHYSASILGGLASASAFYLGEAYPACVLGPLDEAVASFYQQAHQEAIVGRNQQHTGEPARPHAPGNGHPQQHAQAFGDPSFCTEGEKLSEEEASAIQELFNQDIANSAGKANHTRALLMLQCGEVVAEAYASWLNISAETPLLGWSMTKSLTSTLVGIAVDEGLLSLEDVFDRNGDGSLHDDAITLSDLIRMEDGLGFSEVYQLISEPAQMLFKARSTSGYARQKDILHDPGKAWCYHSGATNLASWMLKQAFPSLEAYLRFPKAKLFDPIGAASFSVGIDAEGTMVGSSFSYATARDWAKFGQLHLQGGKWDGKQVVSSDFLDGFAFQRLTRTSEMYSGGWWHTPSDAQDIALLEKGVETKCTAMHLQRSQWQRRSIPREAIFASGYKGQFVIIVPSRKLVLVRLGYGFHNDVDGPAVFGKLFRDILGMELEEA